MFDEGDKIPNDKKLAAQAAGEGHEYTDDVKSEGDVKSVGHDSGDGGAPPQTKTRSGSIYHSLDMSNSDSPVKARSASIDLPTLEASSGLLTEGDPTAAILSNEGEHTPLSSTVPFSNTAVSMIDDDGYTPDNKDTSPIRDGRESIDMSSLEASSSQLTGGNDQDQLSSAIPLSDTAASIFHQKITTGAQRLLITANGEAKPPSEESALLENSVKIDEASKELSSDHLLYGGAIVGFVIAPAIRCLNDYVSGNKDKTCADHYYATFSTTNLLHVASSYVASSVLRAISVSSFDKNDYFCKKYPFALGLAYTAGYDALDLSISLVKSGYNLLAGNSEDSGSDL